MSLFEVGRLCIKIAGRDAGKKGVVVERLDNTFVLIDGLTRRKKVNIKHLEPLAEIIELRERASHEAVIDAFEKLGLKVAEKKSKQVPARLKKQKAKKEVKTQPKKTAKVKKKEEPKKITAVEGAEESNAEIKEE